MEYITDLTKYIHPLTNISAHFEICYKIPRTQTWWNYMNQDFESTLNIVRFLLALGREARVKDKKTGHVVSIASLEELNLFYNRLTDRCGKKTEKP